MGLNVFHKLTKGYNRIVETTRQGSVLVYQMGKVGSSSIEASLPNAAHLHTLYANPPCDEVLRVERPTVVMKLFGVLYDWLRRVAVYRRGEVKIITVIRSPVERNVSMFFQDFPFWYLKYRRVCPTVSRFSDEAMINDMYEKVFPHDYVDTWFDKEIRRLTGIDVYEKPFDLEKGVVFFEKGKYRLLLLEMTKIESCWPVVEEFVGQKLTLTSVNKGDHKWYAPIYRKHKDVLLENAVVSSRVKAGKFYQHFYGVRVV